MTKQNKMQWLAKMIAVLIFFGVVFYAVFTLAAKASNITTDAQKIVFPIGIAALLSGLSVLWIVKQIRLFGDDEEYSKWYFPIFSALLAFVCMALAYAYVGMWPIGTKSAMIVDMHHQYAPLLAQLRNTLLNGDSFLYSFDLGLGANYIPLFGYYLASPLNIILIFFPFRLLDTALLVITLLKNMLSAFFFAWMVQYVYGKKTYAIPTVSVMFSMMMYLISYSWNIMWLDVVMVLPLCVLGFEKLMREKKHLLYVLTLAYALFSNYYIGFMLCIFLTLYYIVHLVSADQTAKDAAKGFFRFGFYSVLAGMLAAFVLLPIALSLGHTSAADGGFVDWKTNFDFLDLIGRHLYDVSPTIRSGNMPNIYCGLLAVFLLPIFATLKSIPVKRRGALLGLWAVMALSLTITNFDLFWHGLHSPNDLPYRFSFVYSFSLLLIAYEALIRVKEWQPKQVGFTLCGVIVYIFMEEKFGDGTYSFKSLYLSLAFIVIYAIITLLINNKKLLKEAGYSFLMLVVVGEMLTSSCGSFIKLNQNEYYTAHFDYTDNAITEVTASAVKEMEKLGDAEAGEFYRLEVLPRRTCADTALFDYNGITIFASSNRHEETRFMGSLGYAVNGVNSFLYHFFVPFSDDLLGIRYVAMNDEFTSTKQLKERMNVSLDGNSYTIYENTDALSVGYFVDSNIKSFNYDYYNPFESNNTLGSYMTGNYGSIYEYQQVTAGESGGVSGTYSVSVASGTSDFKVIPSRAGRMYLYVDCRAAENISATMYYNGSNGTQTSNYWSCAPYEPYIIDVGNVDTDDELDVTIEAKSSCGGNVYACILNEPVYNEEIETLKANQMKVTKFTDTKVEGNLIAPRDGCVFTSIPYDEGWTVKVDGKKVKTFDAGNAMLAIDIKAGSHTITMSFFPEGLGLGLTCTILAILILVFLAWIARHPEKTNKAKKKIAMILLNLMKKSEKSSEETEEEDSAKEEPKPAPVKKVKAPKKAEKPEESKKDEETDDWFEE